MLRYGFEIDAQSYSGNPEVASRNTGGPSFHVLLRIHSNGNSGSDCSGKPTPAYLASFLCASIQDVAKSPGLVHGLDKLTRGYGKEENPRKAFVVISIIAVIISMLGEFIVDVELKHWGYRR